MGDWDHFPFGILQKSCRMTEQRLEREDAGVCIVCAKPARVERYCTQECADIHRRRTRDGPSWEA